LFVVKDTFALVTAILTFNHIFFSNDNFCHNPNRSLWFQIQYQRIPHGEFDESRFAIRYVFFSLNTFGCAKCAYAAAIDIFVLIVFVNSFMVGVPVRLLMPETL